MEVAATGQSPREKKDAYSVWALPPEDLAERIKKLMDGLRSEFGGPRFEPHITVVGAIRLTADDALRMFRSACDGLTAYNASADRVATGSFFYQCVFLLLHQTADVSSNFTSSLRNDLDSVASVESVKLLLLLLLVNRILRNI